MRGTPAYSLDGCTEVRTTYEPGNISMESYARMRSHSNRTCSLARNPENARISHLKAIRNLLSGFKNILGSMSKLRLKTVCVSN